MTLQRNFKLPEEREPRTALLQFDGAYEGAQIRMSIKNTIGEVLEFQRLAGDNDLEHICEMLMARIVDWNLADHEITKEGFETLSPEFVNAIVRGYLTAVAGVDVPLGPESSNGNGSPALKELTSQLSLASQH